MIEKNIEKLLITDCEFFKDYLNNKKIVNEDIDKKRWNHYRKENLEVNQMKNSKLSESNNDKSNKLSKISQIKQKDNNNNSNNNTNEEKSDKHIIVYDGLKVESNLKDNYATLNSFNLVNNNSQISEIPENSSKLSLRSFFLSDKNLIYDKDDNVYNNINEKITNNKQESSNKINEIKTEQEQENPFSTGNKIKTAESFYNTNFSIYDGNNRKTIKSINNLIINIGAVQINKNESQKQASNKPLKEKLKKPAKIEKTKISEVKVESNIKTPSFKKLDQQIEESKRKYLNSKNILSYKDYEEMKFKDLIIYDKRTFWVYYWQTLINEHCLLEIILKRSLLQPKLIRVISLFSTFSLDFTLNAIFYSDDYISAKYYDSLNNIEVDSFYYTIKTQIAKSIWSLIASSFITTIIHYLQKPGNETEKKLMESIKSKDIISIEKAK